MTALALSKRTGLAIEESALLQERNFGDLRGTPYAALQSNPFGPDFAPPNGEDWAAFYQRAAQAFELIVARRRALADAHGTLVVVTHGLVCRALVERHVDRAGLVPERFDNTSITIFAADPPHTVSLLNCTRHLSATQAAAGEGGAA
jgi:probable phosphoglycerate mutase